MRRVCLVATCAAALCGSIAYDAAAQSQRVAHISRRVRKVLLADARSEAVSLGDPYPRDIQAVRTTHVEAGRLRGVSSTALSPDSLVYLVAMRGRFNCLSCSAPHGGHVRPGSVVTLELTARTMRRDSVELSKRYPDLGSVGVPVRLEVGR